MQNHFRISVPALIAVALLACSSTRLNADDRVPEQLRGMTLLPGYQLVRLQGFDSIVGKITKENGLTIQYEIGRITKPGGPELGGDFHDITQTPFVPADQRQWHKEQTIQGEPVHLTYTKQNVLRVSYPTRGINFSVEVTNSAQMTDALLMLLTVPSTVAAKK